MLAEAGGGVSLDQFGSPLSRWYRVERVTVDYIIVRDGPDLPILMRYLPKADIQQSMSADEWVRAGQRTGETGDIIDLPVEEPPLRRYEIMHVHREEDFAKVVAAVRSVAGKCAVIVLPEYHLATALPFETLRRAVMSVNWILYVRLADDGPDTRERER